MKYALIYTSSFQDLFTATFDILNWGQTLR